MSAALVRGEIVFEPPVEDLSGAAIYIRLEQTSLADLPARLVRQEIMENLPAHIAPGAAIPFELSGPPPDPRERYTLQVHVDLHRSGRIQAGDYINMESYPVLTFGYPDRVVIRVRRV